MRRWYSSRTLSSLRIVWGSQTGTATLLARLLAQEASAKGLDVICEGADEFVREPRTLPDQTIVFIQATYGQGEPTDNAVGMFKWLKDNKSALKDTKIALFGLGQSKTYPERYQAAAKELEKLLDESGAKSLLPRGEGDDNGDVEEDFDDWKLKLFETLETNGDSKQLSNLPGSKENSEENDVQVEISGTSTLIDQPRQNTVGNVIFTDFAAMFSSREIFVPWRDVDMFNPYPAPVTAIRDLQSVQSPRMTKHIELSIEHAEKFEYEAGDYLGVVPRNSSAKVEEFAHLLNLDLDQTFLLSKKSASHIANMHFPLSIRDYLIHYADVQGPLRKFSLQKAMNFSCSVCMGDIQDMIDGKSVKMSFLDLVRKFPGLKIPFDVLVDILPPLLPRFYSISSSPRMHKRHVHLTVGLHQFEASPGTFRGGVSSSFICSQKIGNRIPIFLKRSLFKLPESPCIPIIMIGAGTGMAPFRAFLQERPESESLLFFGCMHRAQDFIYEDELRSLDNVRVINAFSHDQDSRIFVQHRLIEHSQLVYDWIFKNNASVYVCGQTEMYLGVRKALKQLISKHGSMSLESAGLVLEEMQGQSRFCIDSYG